MNEHDRRAGPQATPPRVDPRRRRWLARAGSGLAAGCALVLAGCQLSPIGSNTIRVDRRQIERALASRFPYRTRWLAVFDVEAQPPALELLPDRNRIGAEVELRIAERLFDNVLRGLVGFEGALRFDTVASSLKLVDVQVGRVAVAGLPTAAAGQAGRLGAMLAEQLLEGLDLYTLTAEQRDELRRRNIEPGAVTVTGNGLEIALVTRESR